MTIEELTILLKFLKSRYDPKWFVAVMFQFTQGLRASEMLNLQIMDFKEKFTKFTYRQAKSDQIIYNEPIPKPMSELIIHYCYYNQHRFKNGYLFPSPKGKKDTYSTETYGAFWSKWRKAIAKDHPKFMDRYVHDSGQVRYRIGSHSLRRLHRTILRKNIKDLYIVKELCNYADYSSLQRYINEEEIQEKKADYLLPIFNPLVNQLQEGVKGQKLLSVYV